MTSKGTPSMLQYHAYVFTLEIINMCISLRFWFYLSFVYKQVGSHFGWRCAFWVEAILMLPFAILGFVMKPLQLKGAYLSCVDFLSFLNYFSCIDFLSYRILFCISELLLDAGFVPAGSKKVLAADTVVSGVQGTIMF